MPSADFLAARNRHMLAQAVGIPDIPPRPCAQCGNEMAVARNRTQPGGWRYYCNVCRNERRRARDGHNPQGSRAHREKQRAAREEVLRRDDRTSLDG